MSVAVHTNAAIITVIAVGLSNFKWYNHYHMITSLPGIAVFIIYVIVNILQK